MWRRQLLSWTVVTLRDHTLCSVLFLLDCCPLHNCKRCVRSASSFLFIKLSDGVEDQVDILSYSMSPIFVSSSTGRSVNNTGVNEAVAWGTKGVFVKLFCQIEPSQHRNLPCNTKIWEICKTTFRLVYNTPKIFYSWMEGLYVWCNTISVKKDWDIHKPNHYLTVHNTTIS
jgi:hypothetical protein